MKPAKRLQAYLAECGVASRRAAEALIESGAVKVNGQVVTQLGTKVIPGQDRVVVRGRLVAVAEKRLYLFYKPRGVVTTMSDPQRRPCIAHYVRNLPVRVFPVGRLDADVSGLLLLTNDGMLAEKLLHPRFGVSKIYWALVPSAVERDALRKLTSGTLSEGRASSAQLLSPSARTTQFLGRVPLGYSLIELRVKEGKKHFVKNLLSEAGFPAEKLFRVQFGPYKIASMRPGQIIEVAREKQ